jgi:hypothetical protein
MIDAVGDLPSHMVGVQHRPIRSYEANDWQYILCIVGAQSIDSAIAITCGNALILSALGWV